MNSYVNSQTLLGFSCLDMAGYDQYVIVPEQVRGENIAVLVLFETRGLVLIDLNYEQN